MSYINYSEINALGEFPMIAGTDWTLEFTCYEDGGVVLQDIGGATITFAMCPYGDTSYNVLEITGTITGQYTFEIAISGVDTEDFSGKYIYQITIDSFFGERLRPAQGIILVSPAITLN